MNDARIHDIEVRVRDAHQLFNSMDPSPFLDRDLDPDAEDYIVGWADEHPRGGPFRLVVHLDQAPEDPGYLERAGTAIRHYFAYREDVERRALRRLMREARASLLIGLAFLAACMVTSELLGSASGTVPARIASEGLLIGGWVAMWRPMELCLYGWWPVLGRRRLLGRLSRMPVEFRLAGAAR